MEPKRVLAASSNPANAASADGYDAVVIGAGVIGSAIALQLTRHGYRTLCVDKLPAAGYGSTSSSSAIIRFTYTVPSSAAMAYEGSRYWLDWESHIGDIGDLALCTFVQVPQVVPAGEGSHLEKVLPNLDSFSIPYEHLSIAEVQKRYPYADWRRYGPPARLDDLDSPFWGEPARRYDSVVVTPGAGYINDPQLAAQNLAAAAVREGATFRFNTEVVAIERNADRVSAVTLRAAGDAEAETVAAPVVVNVGGPHARKLNEMAGVLDSMNRSSRALRREVYVVDGPAGVDFARDGFVMGDVDTGIYFRPEAGGTLLIGNAEPECDVLEWIEDPDDYDETLNHEEFQLHAMRAARRLPDVAIPLTKRGLVSLYDATPDWTPIYDRTSLDGFYVACGTSGNQFKMAPVAGEVMAQLIDAVQSGHDHDNDPLIVTGRYTGNEIDLGTFTRTRVVPDDTHMNVFG